MNKVLSVCGSLYSVEEFLRAEVDQPSPSPLNLLIMDQELARPKTPDGSDVRNCVHGFDI